MAYKPKTRRPSIKSVKQLSKAELRERVASMKPWDDIDKVLTSVKYLFQDDEAYHNWYNQIYDQYRWSDHDRYEHAIWDKYLELRTDEAMADIENFLTNYAQNKAQNQELQLLRKIHGLHFANHPEELDILRRIHHKWAHPARSDRGDYTQITPYWEGDV